MPPPASEPIGLELARTAKLVSRAFDDALVEGGGSLPTWLILLSLKRHQHGAQREIAEEIGIEGPTLTHHLNRLEASGLVTRTRDRQNRRLHRVELTEAGDALFARLLLTARSFDTRLRKGLRAAEVTELRAALQLLRENASPVR